MDRSGPSLWVLLRRREPRPPRRTELRRPEPGEERELAAAAANVELLARSARPMRRGGTARELDALREELGRELMRKSFEAAHLEWATEGPRFPRDASSRPATRPP